MYIYSYFCIFMIFFRRSIDIALYACIINRSKKKDGLYKNDKNIH